MRLRHNSHGQIVIVRCGVRNQSVRSDVRSFSDESSIYEEGSVGESIERAQKLACVRNAIHCLTEAGRPHGSNRPRVRAGGERHFENVGRECEKCKHERRLVSTLLL